jgi:hypothetical protein
MSERAEAGEGAEDRVRQIARRAMRRQSAQPDSGS